MGEYTKTNWVDRSVQFPRRFKKSLEDTTSVTLTPDPGTVTDDGTPVNAANLNKIENGLESLFDRASTGPNGILTIPTATDMNNIKKPGNYKVDTTITTLNLPPNVPARGSNFQYLEVITGASDTSYSSSTIQRLSDFFNPFIVWVRTGISAGWNSWQQVAFTAIASINHLGKTATLLNTESFPSYTSQLIPQLGTSILNITVNPANPNDDGPNNFKTINGALNYISSLKFRAGRVSIGIKSATYNEDVSLDGFQGTYLAIYCDSGSLTVKSFKLTNIGCYCYVGNINTSAGAFYAFDISRCFYVNLDNCSVPSAITGVRASESRVNIQRGTYSSCSGAVFQLDSSWLTAYMPKGTGNAIGYSVSANSIAIQTPDTTPLAATTLKKKDTGGVILGDATPTY